MKRLCLLLMVLSMTSALTADVLSEGVVARMREALTGRGVYMMTFVVEAEGMDDTKGKLLVADGRYRIEVGEQLQLGDANVKYDVNAAQHQVVIENVEEGANDLFSNPAAAFDFGTEMFDMTYGGLRDAGGRRCELITMTPKGAELGGVDKVELYVDREKALPVVLAYDYFGAVLRIVIENVDFPTEPSVEEFVFDAKKYQGWEIIDFR